mmetsp:Transcript_7085/g.16203  ORF Transcript_7085/g.16203 Transcript_7085/m.16203 type:complete len:216 (-) Transcript_7085:1728-2375(-)
MACSQVCPKRESLRSKLVLHRAFMIPELTSVYLPSGRCCSRLWRSTPMWQLCLFTRNHTVAMQSPSPFSQSASRLRADSVGILKATLWILRFTTESSGLIRKRDLWFILMAAPSIITTLRPRLGRLCIVDGNRLRLSVPTAVLTQRKSFMTMLLVTKKPDHFKLTTTKRTTHILSLHFWTLRRVRTLCLSISPAPLLFPTRVWKTFAPMRRWVPS